MHLTPGLTSSSMRMTQGAEGRGRAPEKKGRQRTGFRLLLYATRATGWCEPGALGGQRWPMALQLQPPSRPPQTNACVYDSGPGSLLQKQVPGLHLVRGAWEPGVGREDWSGPRPASPLPGYSPHFGLRCFLKARVRILEGISTIQMTGGIS